MGAKVAEPSRLCQFSLQQLCCCGETPQPPWWFVDRVPLKGETEELSGVRGQSGRGGSRG